MKKTDKTSEKILGTIKKFNMIRKNDRIVIALSGGPDSVFLLHVLNRLKEKLNIVLFAFHLNHCLRGNDADKDQNFCKDLCEKLGIPIKVCKQNVRKFASKNGVSIEEAGHIIRYKLYREVLNSFQADKVATGHTFDDQAETVLLRFVTGSGKRGFSGINPKRDGFIIRPLLEIRKNDILEYLAGNNLSYRIDKTNFETIMFRNKIRNILIPMLKENFNPKIEENLCRIATIFQEEIKYLDDLTNNYLNRFARIRKDRATLEIEETLSLSPYISRYLLRKLIERFSGSLRDITFEHSNDLLNLMEGRTGATIMLPGNLKVEKEYRYLVFRNIKGEEKPHLPEVSLVFPGVNLFPEWEIKVTGEIFNEIPGDIKDNPYSITVDYDECRGKKFLLRPRKNGDRFSPLGMSGSKKIKDYFIDMKIPRRLRDRIPIIQCGDDILWVVFYRQSELYRLKTSTKRVLHIRIEKLAGDI